jgi:uncharacterized membrane protein YdbT with pleckstrin-like domain
MSYVNDNLMPNERVLFSARIHPAIFLPAIFSFLMTVVFVIFTFSMAGQNGSAGSYISYIPTMLMCLSGLLLFYTLVVALQALIVMLTTEFAVTNRRVIAKTGFIRRHTLEMLLSKIESVAVHQNITGRLLNFGTVIVTGTGGTKEGFKAITAPLAVRQTINQIIEKNAQAFMQQQGSANPAIG